MPVYQLHKTQHLRTSVDEIWDFISSPRNLKEITPDYMGFEITSHLQDEKMYPGMIVSYKVKPILGIPMTWVTEITQVKHKQYFVDEQRVGPYSMWHHEHILEEKDGGVLMTDIITYQPPLGFIGGIAKKLFIGKQLEGIFNYRRQILEERYNR